MEADRQLKASWIWTGLDLPIQNQFVHFRKTFTLNHHAEFVECLITAERFYQLWINGKWVGQGPAPSHPYQKLYDLYEVSDALIGGENVIAATVQFDGDLPIRGSQRLRRGSGRWYTIPTIGAFWCQLEIQGDRDLFLIPTDETWSTWYSRSRHSDVHRLNDQYFQEIYSFGKEPYGWRSAGFDEGSWTRALVLGDSTGKSKTGGSLPWRNLTPRPFPPFSYDLHLPQQVSTGEVIEKMSAEDGSDIALRMTTESVAPLSKASIRGEAFLMGADHGDCVLSNSDPSESPDSFDGIHCATMIFDFASIRNAHLLLEVEGPSGAYLDIGYGPDLVDGKVNPYRSPRTSWADRIILDNADRSPADNGKWRSFFFRQFRYLQITLRNASEPVRLRRVVAEQVTNTWESTANFYCSDSDLNAFWSMAEKTAELCTLDMFVDNASREMRQYSGDIAQMVPATFALHGDTPFCHSYFRQISMAQREDGIFMDCSPGKEISDDITIAYDHGFLHVHTIWEYFVRFGRRSLLEEHWGAIKRHLSVWGSMVNGRGLLTVEGTRETLKPAFLYPWFDWADIDRRGEQLLLNAFYLLNLREGAEIARIMGEKELASEYQTKGEKISGILRSEFWDAQRGVFVDALIEGEQSSKASEHAQGMMLLLGLAEASQADRIVELWRNSPDTLAEAEISFLYYILKGLVGYGFRTFALATFRRLNRHRHAGREAFGETWSLSGSPAIGRWMTMDARAVAQGSAAWPLAYLLEEVAGLQPRWGTRGALRLAPFGEIENLKMEWCNTTLHWKRDARKCLFEARFPNPTPIEFVLPFAPGSVRSLHCNGKEVAVESPVHFEPRTQLDVGIERA